MRRGFQRTSGSLRDPQKNVEDIMGKLDGSGATSPERAGESARKIATLFASKGLYNKVIYSPCRQNLVATPSRRRARLPLHVERLMKHKGLEGVRRGKVVPTTIADTTASYPLDRVIGSSRRTV